MLLNPCATVNIKMSSGSCPTLLDSPLVGRACSPLRSTRHGLPAYAFETAAARPPLRLARAPESDNECPYGSMPMPFFPPASRKRIAFTVPPIDNVRQPYFASERRRGALKLRPVRSGELEG